MRDWLERNPVAVILACGFLALVALLYMFRDRDGSGVLDEDETWYYDVVKEKVFSGKALQLPPITSPWGNEGVRVMFFSCGQCNLEERFPGFFFKFTPAMKQKLQADPSLWQVALADRYEGRMYSRDGKTWVEGSSVAESGVATYLRDKCFGSLISCP